MVLDRLRRDGQIVAKDLSREFGLSEDTIRRDLRELAKEGALLRVHGGALPSSPALADLAGRERIAPEAKAVLGRAAAALVQAGQIVAIDGGTTNVQLVRALPPDLRATVVTHSPTIAVELLQHSGIEVILIGGKLFKHSMVSIGAAAIEAIERIHTDIFFLGATGLHPKAGVTTGDLEEAYVKRAFSRNSAETVLLVSPEKLNAASPFLIIPIAELGGIVVENSVEDEVLEPYEAAGISIHRA